MIEHVYKLDNHSIVIIFTTNAIFIFYFFRSLVRFILFFVRTVNRVSNFKIINSLARKNAKNMFRRGIFIRERACACVNKFACAYVVAEFFLLKNDDKCVVLLLTWLTDAKFNGLYQPVMLFSLSRKLELIVTTRKGSKFVIAYNEIDN